MSIEAWFSVLVAVFILVTLALTNLSADLVFVAGVTLLVLPIFHGDSGWHGVLSAREAVAGLGDSQVVTIGVLFVVVTGLKQTGALAAFVSRILGRPKSSQQALLRMMIPIAGASAFINNTPLVAIMIPMVKDWAEKNRISLSKVMIPLSFATILGGVCSLIGTSTNLTVYSLIQRDTPELLPMGMFEISKIGIPLAIIGIIYLYLTAPWLLPERKSAMASLSDPREYTIEMTVETNSPLVGRTIEQAGLRHLTGVYLVEIEREDEILQAVGPHERLKANDRLIFVGVVDSVKDLQRIRGLTPATNQVFKLDSPRSHRRLVEAVVSESCPLVGKSIREGRFRTIYDAAVIAVARNGERVRSKIGDIVIRNGDTLLLEAHPSFVERMSNRRDFLLVSQVADSAPVRHDRAWIALVIALGMILAMSTQTFDVMVAAMVAAGLMIITRCVSASDARLSVDWQLLVVIAASLGVAKALQDSGAAEAISASVVSMVASNAMLALLVVYLMTMIFTELLSNNAAAAMLFPIAVGTAKELDVNPMTFVITVMIAASCSFATPIGYQTNMMVYGPGGYKFMDYVRIGAPLNILMVIVTVLLAPIIWPFR